MTKGENIFKIHFYLFLVPSHQYRKIMTGRASQEKHSPSKSNDSRKSSPKKQSKSSKVPTQSRDTNKKSKSDNLRGSVKPKSLEQAFKNLTAEDFASYLEKLEIVYPGSKLAWLKEVCFYEKIYFSTVER